MASPFFSKKNPKKPVFFWGPNSNACPSSSLAVDKAWFLFWTWSYAASWGGEGLPPPTVRRNRWVKTNSQTIILIVLLKKNRFLIMKVVVEFSHRKSCGSFFRFGGRLGSNCKKLCLIDSIFATKKKRYRKSDFQVPKSPSFLSPIPVPVRWVTKKQLLCGSHLRDVEKVCFVRWVMLIHRLLVAIGLVIQIT